MAGRIREEAGCEVILHEREKDMVHPRYESQAALTPSATG
jgi:hypothetical protein